MITFIPTMLYLDSAMLVTLCHCAAVHRLLHSAIKLELILPVAHSHSSSTNCVHDYCPTKCTEFTLIRAFSCFAGGSSTPPTQVIGYLSERTILSCPHKVPLEHLTAVQWEKGTTMLLATFISKPRHGQPKIIIIDATFTDRVLLTYNTLEITSVNLRDEGLYGCVPSEDDRPSPYVLESNLTIYGKYPGILNFQT